ncbi:MAG: biotin/lipoyl-containing protein [Bacteroidota bacterium]|nr:biotin/lipoyl-binding protein [Candidatus Kapabacteria bacterium]MDW8220144.1 biotin/lipoyl-containing protein [Bacteroidota bacterium]
MKYFCSSEYLDGEFIGIVRDTTVYLSDTKAYTFERDTENPSILYFLSSDGTRYPVIIVDDSDEAIRLSYNGYTYTIYARSERDMYFQRLLKATATTVSGSVKVTAPMPGLLKAVNIQQGQHVKKGERLFILEAMKMENDIKAPIAGVVSSVHVEADTAVEKNFLLCTIDATSSA